MTDLRIDKDKAERMIALILREDKQMGPSEANELALKIGTRLQAAMALPTKPGLRGYRLIQDSPGWGQTMDFTNEVASKIADVDEHVARALWEMVYRRGRDIPDDVAVPPSY